MGCLCWCGCYVNFDYKLFGWDECTCLIRGHCHTMKEGQDGILEVDWESRLKDYRELYLHNNVIDTDGLQT